MKIVIHANSVDWQREYLPRFTAGFVAHGDRVLHRQEDEPEYTLNRAGRKIYEHAVQVIFANNAWKLTALLCQKKGIPLLTVGRCLFGSRFDMVAIGWDGFNGAADFMLDDEMPDDRWQKHGWELTTDVLHQVNSNPDGYVLVCGEFRPTAQWITQLKEDLKGEDVRFRAHPFKVGETVPGWKNAAPVGQDNIAELFPECKAVVTYDSIAGCDAVLAGVPTICYGENAMARPVAYKNWNEFTTTGTKWKFGVQAWANRLAYCQWSHDEITKGEFWKHLKSRIDPDKVAS